MKPIAKQVLVVALGLTLLASAGCVSRVPIPGADKVTDRTETVTLGDAQAVDLGVDMGAGELTLVSSTASEAALTGHFTYTPVRLAPQVDSSTMGTTRKIRIHQSSGTIGIGLDARTIQSKWDLALAPGVPTSLDVQMGAGDANLDLRHIELTRLALDQGAGKNTVDLSDQHGDLDVKATLGAGELTIKVPRNVRVAVSGLRDGVGEWSAPNFTEKDGRLVNGAYLASPEGATITIDVERGVGKVTVIEAN